MMAHGSAPTRPIDGQPLSFIIPFRLDMPDRLSNLRTITSFIVKHFPKSERILVEVDAKSKVPPEIAAQYHEHVFIEDAGPFSRARSMNAGLLRSTRPIAVFYDVDVLIDPAAAQEAIDAILAGHFPIVLPYNGVCLDVGGRARQRIVEELDAGNLARQSASALKANKDITVRAADGGVFFGDRELMALEGGFNSKMISYGWEDLEVLKRMEKLGYFRKYLDYNLVHLDHSRGPDSVKNEHYDNNREEFLRVSTMSTSQLRRYVETDLALSRGAEVQSARERVRRTMSRSKYGLTRALGLRSKIKSRLARRL